MTQSLFAGVLILLLNALKGIADWFLSLVFLCIFPNLVRAEAKKVKTEEI